MYKDNINQFIKEQAEAGRVLIDTMVPVIFEYIIEEIPEDYHTEYLNKYIFIVKDGYYYDYKYNLLFNRTTDKYEDIH